MNTQSNIPFSWENQPGVCKADHHENLVGVGWRVSVHDNSSKKERRTVFHNNSSTTEEMRSLSFHDDSSTKKGRKIVIHDNSSTGKDWRSLSFHENSSVKEGRLPPPPCENLNKATSHDLGLPLPPCVFQPNLRSSSKRSNKDDDPFLMAYKECTKSHRKGSLMKKTSILGSCKYSCNVRDDSIVRVSQIPMSNIDGKRSQGLHRNG